MNTNLPPLMPDDFDALAAIAGPLFKESRLIESYTSDSPIPNGMVNDGSYKIQNALEQARSLAQASYTQERQLHQIHPQPVPQYMPPPEPHPVPQYMPPPEPQPLPAPIQNSTETQLEFCFEKTEQKITNDLLREISKKLTKLISLIDNSEGQDKIPKSNK